MIQRLGDMVHPLPAMEPNCSGNFTGHVRSEKGEPRLLAGQTIEDNNETSTKDVRIFPSSPDKAVLLAKDPSIISAKGSTNPLPAVICPPATNLPIENTPNLTPIVIPALGPTPAQHNTSSGDPSQNPIHARRRNLVAEHRNHRILKGAMNKYLPKAFKMRSKGDHASKAGSRVLGGTQRLAQQLIRHVLHYQHGNKTTLTETFRNSEISVIMESHPKYQQLLRAVPALVVLLPEGIRDGLTSSEGTALLKMGLLVAEKWVSGA